MELIDFRGSIPYPAIVVAPPGIGSSGLHVLLKDMPRGTHHEMEWLVQWRTQLCDGHFEHECGIEITTLDNPGWGVVIDLRQTELEDRPMPEHIYDNGSSDWIHCMVEGNEFRGHGDNLKLFDIIRTFREWAVANGSGLKNEAEQGGDLKPDHAPR